MEAVRGEAIGGWRSGRFWILCAGHSWANSSWDVTMWYLLAGNLGSLVIAGTLFSDWPLAAEATSFVIVCIFS